jgi:hypothetical protein
MGTGYMIEEGKDKYPIIAGSGKTAGILSSSIPVKREEWRKKRQGHF